MTETSSAAAMVRIP